MTPVKWIEVIAVRTTAGDAGPIRRHLKRICKSLKTPGLVRANILIHACVRGDFAVSLLWETKNPEPFGSTPAIGLARELKRFGLVDHSDWLVEGTKDHRE
jgi:hypothetical protein